MGGKRNKSKKFLREKHNKKHTKQNKKTKNSDKKDVSNNNYNQDNNYKNKKAKELFNAGINALNEQPEIDVGLQYNEYNEYNGYNDSDDMLSFQDDSIDDIMSLQSEVTIDSMDIIIDNNDEIDSLINNLLNKDSNIRIESLNKLNNKLRLYKLNENDFNNNNERLQISCKNLLGCVRRGSINEILNALDTICLLSLTLMRSDGLDFVIKYFQNIIKNLIQRPKSAKVQIKAINIWSIMVWCYNDDTVKLSSIKLFEYFWDIKKEKDKKYEKYENEKEDHYEEENENEKEKENETDNKNHKNQKNEISIEAIESWLFLITTICDNYLLLDSYFFPLLKLLRLESSTIQQKICIGKALTVLIDNYNTFCDHNININTQENVNHNININTILIEFNHLKSNHSKSQKKKEFLNQRAKFRDYLKTLEKDNPWKPIIVIKLHHKKFELIGWNKWIQYHAFKKILNHGLQCHLLNNKKIKNHFDINIDSQPIILSKNEKKNKKIKHYEKQKNIKKKRGKKRFDKHRFIFDKTLID